ncbi:MAG: helix-turn-helix domain-containing protein [Bacilli bacterium]|nr:helix-turn-helix domain-containing protein [Bacilli bacterium]
MKFGDKLIALRKKAGMSQEELAEKLGVSRQSVSKWESNNTYPETDKIVQICNIFDCSMDDLINDNISTIENIERKSKNNLNVVLDSFLEFITKTINMFCDMKFISGLKCVIEMIILSVILIIAGLVIVSFTSYIVIDLFSFIPSIVSDMFCQVIESLITILFVILSIIILVHVFKIRYLDYYDKVLDEKTNQKDGDVKNEKISISKKEDKKIKFESNPKIIIRDEKHRPFAFLSILSRIIIFFIKFMLMFFVLGLIFSLLIFIVLFIISISLITTNAIFIGSTLALASAISVNIILLLVIINFIFNKKPNYKIMLIIFMSSVLLFGIGIGISTISLKNIEIKEENIKTITKEEKIPYDEDMIILNYYLGDVEYVIDDSLNNNIKLMIEYDDRFYSHNLVMNQDYYKMNKTFVSLHTNTNILKIYNEITKDLKNNILRDYTNDNYMNITVVSSKNVIEKIIGNTKKVYFVDETNTENGYILSNFEHRISGYTECTGNYNAKTNEISTDLEGCTCKIRNEKTNRGDIINYSCDWD